MQKQFNLNPKTRSNEGNSIRCHSSLSYDKERNNRQSVLLRSDEAINFSQRFAKIVNKFCPNVQMNFFDDNWEKVIQRLDSTFQKILEDMKEQLNIEFIEKEEYLKKTTANLIKYEELLNKRKKEFDEKCAEWTKHKDEENNKLQKEKKEIVILKCRLQKEFEIKIEKLEEKEKKAFEIIEKFEGMHSDLMKSKIENQNITWDILQQSLKLEEKAAIIAWKEKTIKEDLKVINEEKSKLENEKKSNTLLKLELLNKIPKVNNIKRSSSSIEKLDFYDSPSFALNSSPSFALNSSHIDHDSFHKEETHNFSSKNKNSSFSNSSKLCTTKSESNIKNEIFNGFTRTIPRQEAYERKSLLKKIREKEIRNSQLKDEKIKQEKEREKLENLAYREKEIIEKTMKEQHRQECERKIQEKREQERIDLEKKELEKIRARKIEQERIEHQRIEDQFKDEIMTKVIIKERELEEKNLEIELYEKMLKDERLRLDFVKDDLTNERQELQSEKLVFYEEIIEERKKIEEYFTDIASKTSILNSRKEEILKAKITAEDKEIMKELEKKVGKSSDKSDKILTN
ncbi:hypothetical protein SteCoe_27006 [Stentor coeruleus]|uniref:Uncharacterized protein n=1 Tax=Stentor coeruleus TaxID=5963 RepID=A0A1R2BBH9_9CILI|nr:hypothetical protein SteCoe_27006 [Stentor coeruleus]